MSSHNATVKLWIRHRTAGYPPLVKDGTTYDNQGNLEPEDTDDKVPWKLAEWRQGDLPGNSVKRHGHRPKKSEYFYRFTGGNAYYDEHAGPPGPGVPVNNGDLEFEINKGTKIVHVSMDADTVSARWKFCDVALSGPLSSGLLQPPTTTFDIENDTNHSIITSGQICMVVKQDNQGKGQDVYLYVDPGWDNRK